MKIQARGHMVEIVSKENGSQLIDRKEAILCARGIMGLDKGAQDLVEALLLAANQARINELGTGYPSKDLNALLARAKEEAAKI